jgi:hypothetical protein
VRYEDAVRFNRHHAQSGGARGDWQGSQGRG